MAKSIQNNRQILPDETIEEETIEKEDFNFTPYRNEIILIVTLMASIFSLLSILGVGGIIGRLFRTFLFGTMGLAGYIFPFVLFFSIVFILSNYKNRRVLYRIICCIGIYFILMGILQLIFYAQSEEITLITSYSLCAQSTLGGGFFGALLSMPLSSIMGIAGAYVILVAIFLILFTFVTSRFLLSALGYNGKKKIQKIHQQYQAERIEKTVIKESYGKLPPRKRKPAVTFDLMKEEEILPVKKEEPSYTPPKKEKKRMEKKVEMQEYQPIVDEAPPISQNSNEIRKDLEQSLKPLEPIIEETIETIPSKPLIRFVDSYERGGYVRKEIENTENSKNPNQLAESNILPKKAETQEVQTKQESSMEEELPLDISVPEPMVQDVEKVEIEKIEVSKKEETIPISSNYFERFTKEKKFDGSVLEGTTEESIKADIYTDYTNTYVFPPMNLLAIPSNVKNGMSSAEIQTTTERLRQTFESFKVPVTFGNVSCGPAVTRYEIQPNKGVKVSKITNLADDIKLNLAAADIRIEAPIPGKAAIGIEVPNRETTPVMLRELLENDGFQNHKSNIAFAVGKDVAGQPIVTDIAKMPHLLIAGATGSGKSVCINTLIISLLYKSNPDDVKLIMIDPKVVELSVYNGIPHLLIPVVTDPKKASAALNWAVTEMNDRYGKFAELGVRDLSGYNKRMTEAKAVATSEEAEKYKTLPQIVIIVDELADLMMVAPSEVEDSILHLSQMARAAGLHLVIATQRPSVNVITGVIKANVPSRIAFSVSSAVDSRTILDGVGAEKLLGKGDMLFFPSGLPKPIRVQGAFVSDTEVSHVVEFLRQQRETNSYDTTVFDKITAAVSSGNISEASSEKDDYFIEAGKFIIEKDKASIGMLQRVYKIGFNRAARIMDQLADAGVVGAEEGTKPRKILMTMEEFEQYLEKY